MSLPEIVSQAEWQQAREALLVREKELTRARDALVADRRRLPMVEITADYVFDGPDGEARLVDLFEGRRQLIVAHFMFEPDWDSGCASCTAGADENAPGLREHLAVRDTTMAFVSLAPQAKLAAYRAERGWTFPWYSSGRSTFNRDFGATRDDGEYPGRSSFLRVDDRVFHTYSTFARGLESIGGSYYLLDETALGRQEAWEEPQGRAESARAAVPDFAA